MADLFDNPMGLDGFEFVEFAQPTPGVLEGVFATLGFTRVAQHRSKDVALYRQGEINFIVNNEPASVASYFAAEHGPSACGMAFRVRDSHKAYERALSLGAQPVDLPPGPMELKLPAIKGIGGMPLYLIDRYGDGTSIYDIDFKFNEGVDRHPEGHGLRIIDHLTHNVYRGRMAYWAGFYEKIFNFRELRFFDIKGEYTGLTSKAMTAPDGKIRIPLNEEASKSTGQIEEFLMQYNGEGIQHIALLTDDLKATIDSLRQAGVPLMNPPPATYYEMLDERLPGHGEKVDELSARGILLDGTTEGGKQRLLLQIFSGTLLGPVFFEFIQRKGDEGFGEGNFKALFESLERDQLRRGVIEGCMTTALDDTHDPALASWVDTANDPATDFPIQNLPLGRFRRPGETRYRIGAAIGDQIVDVAKAGLLATEDMNEFMRAGTAARRTLRTSLSRGLRAGSADAKALRGSLVPQADVAMGLPCRIGDYTDFYTSIHHATSVGRQFRPDNPLLPNYKWVPIGYHGRASSIGVSPETIRRPRGQFKGADDPAPTFGPSRRLDYELEVGILVAQGNAQGDPIPIDEAESHLFGLALFNDWTARDVQAWEYQPLGPFLSKNFASTLSPWVVTMEALAPFRVPFARAEDDPAPLPYLDSADNRATGALDIDLETWISTAAMRAAGLPPQRLMQSNLRDSYWTLAQLVTHHTVNGCNLMPGDLFGSGTQSGPAPGQGGSMLELGVGGKQPLRLANGESRSFLEDGDTVILRGHCERAGFRRIGFGDCTGTVAPPL